MFEILSGLDVPWEAVDVFQVDERAAPRDDESRNLTLIERTLGDRLRHLHAMPVEKLDAESYAAELEERCGRPPVIDVVHLGLGADGHTASLVPGDPVLDVHDRWVAVTQAYEGYRRMTLTFPALDAARLAVFLVTEGSKAQALRLALDGDPSVPAGRLTSDETVFFATPAAASGAR